MITILAGTPAANTDEMADWLREHDLVPETVFKVNIRGQAGEDGKITVYQYETDDEGDMIKDEAYGGVKRKDPYDIPLQSDLPEAVQNLVGVMEAPV